jgi:hypothetical protein
MYVGEWVCNKRNGEGKEYFTSFDSYEGAFVNNHPHGHGVYLSSGDVYEGEWLNGVRHGNGVFTSQSGLIYRGEWLKGSATGYATITYL